MRKLATIQIVDDVQDIDGADFIQLAKIKGWQCVIKKGDVKKGDKVLYCEIDSFIPITPEFEFLRKSSYKKLADGKEGFRIKSIRLKKQLSQGLAMPLSLFPQLSSEMEVDMDVSELLEISKYEPPIPAHLSGIVKGNFPGWIQKTDQLRIQGLPEYFEMYKETEFEESEKLDGSSCTFFKSNDQFGVCSRNLELSDSETNTQWRLAKELNIKENLDKVGKNVALQGELIGEGINKNLYKIRGQEFRVFDIFDIDAKRLLTPSERVAFISTLENPKIQHVPILNHRLKIFDICGTMEWILEYAKGKSKLNPEVEREGVVFKSHSLHGGNVVSFKVVNNDYLLKYEE